MHFGKTLQETITPQMALEVERLFNETDVYSKGIFSMGGHEDGVVCFGANPAQAGITLIQTYANSLSVLAGRVTA